MQLSHCDVYGGYSEDKRGYVGGIVLNQCGINATQKSEETKRV
jgi:hypothetical protein